MSILDFLLGRPLASSEESTEEIGVAKGVPVFGLDALGSAGPAGVGCQRRNDDRAR